MRTIAKVKAIQGIAPNGEQVEKPFALAEGEDPEYFIEMGSLFMPGTRFEVVEVDESEVWTDPDADEPIKLQYVE